MRKALVVGATGLVGKQLVQKLLSSNDFDSITVLVRKSYPIKHQKLTELIINFDEIDKQKLEADTVFCCLGTTMKKAGSKENFYKVDFTYAFEIAKNAKENGAKQFLLVSAIEANRNSIFYYGRVKGEIEQALTELNFQNLLIFRPSLLVGQRDLDTRLGESIGIVFFELFSFFIPKKYKAVESAKVAQAMMELAQKNVKGKIIIKSNEIQRFNS